MQYFALLIGKERELTPDEGAAEMAAYQGFHAKVAQAIRGGDALLPAATAVRITGGPDAPTITDGPFAEGAEVAGGYYVFEAENLDEALTFARDIPAAKRGAVEVWPLGTPELQPQPLQGTNWIALLLEPPERANTPGSPEWEAMVIKHQEFGAAAGQHIKSARRPASPVDRDHGTGAKRRGPHHRRALHRRRGGCQRLLCAQRRGPRRGRQAGRDDPSFGCGGAAARGGVGTVET